MKMIKIKMVMMLAVLLAIVFIGQGVYMQSQVSEVEDRLHSVQAAYFGQDKATRDSAIAGSVLSQQLVEIQQTPSMLLELKLVGVGKLLTGIAFLLFAILIALMVMPMRLAGFMKENNKE